MTIFRRTPENDHNGIYFIAAALLFLLAAAIGLAGALKIALPANDVDWISMPVIRPLHTFLSISAVLIGLEGTVFKALGTHLHARFQRLNVLALGVFVVAGGLALSTGHASGREYFSWPVIVSLPLLISLVILLGAVSGSSDRAQKTSPEACWLIGFGCFFVFSGFVESHAWKFAAVASYYVRDLSIQWHAIDTFFAGINAALYGASALMMSKQPKPLRPPVLFAIAAFGVLFTFGHHHYISPQPDFLKSLAVTASMLALVSFWRHILHYKKLGQVPSEQSYAPVFWRSIAFWTTIAIASGVLYAVPQINLVIHGTYLVLIHAMGSMIGINMMIIFLAGLLAAPHQSAIRARRVITGVRLINISLFGLWATFGVAGLTKGISRITQDYPAYPPWRDIALYGFPVFGGLILIGLSLLCLELVRAQRAMLAVPEYRAEFVQPRQDGGATSL